jgi:hypothetical protein
MGVWGVGIFESDEAVDARDTFKDLVGQGEDPQAASRKVIDEFCFGSLEDVDNNRIILALARVEHTLGIADPFITTHAFRIIDGEDLTEWGEYARRRKTVLENLRRKLLEDLPPRKVVRPRKLKDTSLEIGKHFLYTEESSGSRILLRAVGTHSDNGGRYCKVTVLDWDGNSDGLERPDLLSPVRKDDSPLHPRQIYIGAYIVGGRVKKANLVELPTTVHVETPGDYGSSIMRWDDLVEHVRNWAITTPTTITQALKTDR